ncbi:FimB/Mfa2 family fimbrial subunit, partial [Bacteroides heparinolyticus]|uniref:FimB/Mfa2 family fimbrial subunit n=1 Tax=Prevotella heparinolytica TaxID=28113 RepID=UPI00359F13DC
MDEKKTNEVYTLQIDWKNAQQAQINYPLWVYFFTEKGIFIKKEQIPKADAVKEWQLPKGKYQYCLLSGFDEKDYQLPLEYGFSSYFSPNKLLEKPLLTGNATILLSQNLRSTVALEYAVAKIEFLLTAMPDDITEIKAMITPVYSGYAFDGNYWDVDKTHAISLTHFDKGEWRSLPTYIFPSD